MVNKFKLYKNFSISKKHKNSILLIGNFDGLHIGHQKLFKLAEKYKKKNKINIGVLTFNPMPKMFFNKKLKNFKISNLKQKVNNFKRFKIDFVIIKKFDKKFSKTSAENFIKIILYRKLKAKLIFVSKNFKFGKNRTGNIKLLKKNENLLNYKTQTVHPLNRNKKIISSTLIRKNIKKGKIHFANKMLGRYWIIEGIVKRGKKLGRKIGFPTCNLDLQNYIVPKLGVYASIVNINKKIKKKAIVNIGYKPTFGKNKLLLEAHIFGLKKNLYDKSIKIMLTRFIRKEKKFKNIIQLKKQIKKDIIDAKK